MIHHSNVNSVMRSLLKQELLPVTHTKNMAYPSHKYAEFYMQRGLNEHKRRHKEKPHKCGTCGKCFALNSKLIEHMAVHSDVKRFKCDECDAAFHLKRGLNDHKRRHKAQTGEYMGASSVCCGKIFTSKPKLDMHLKCFHEKSNEVFE